MKKTEFKKYNLPEVSGVYFFLDKIHKSKSLPKKENILYIGKATILKDRVFSYFSSDLINTRGVRIQSMIENTKDIFYLKTDSVLEAIILESKYIKKFQPFFNVKEKDDKSYSYIIFTKEDFPKVLIKRGRELEKENISILKKFGPFVSKVELVEIMKLIRKTFPYRDKCKIGEKRGCFNYQLGLCPGVCIGKISKAEYAKTLKNIEKILLGNIKSLLKDLDSEMKVLAKKQNFEEAAKLRDSINALTYLKEINFIKNREVDINNSLNSLRIESYDVSHLSGKNRVGVMVVGKDKEFQKAEYKKFKIKEDKNDDIAGLLEILVRRFGHKEWSKPNLIVIDGGKTHLEYIYKNLKKLVSEKELKDIVFTSLVKDEKHKAKDWLFLKKKDENKYKDLKDFIIKLNEETHRFAIKYHKSLRDKLI